jgi:hypothetical protein
MATKKTGRTLHRLNLRPLRDGEALDLRYQGYSYRQISEKLNVSEQRAYQLVQRAMAHYSTVLEEEARHIRETQYGRLEDLLRKTHEIYTGTLDPDLKLKCIARAESIIMYQAKLYGVDVTRVEAVIKAPWQTLLADVVVVDGEAGPTPEEERVLEIEPAPDDDED